MVAVVLRSVSVLALVALLISAQANAQTCPFDNGGSTLEVEGLILTRYALGITGAPLVASTNINAVDAPTVEASINCPSCGLNITGNATMTVADATIISRKLAGFSGAALTDNLALGSGTRNTPAAVQSFLLAGCGATGGTVTSITAGSGLTGGTITTSGTIAADTTFLQRRLSSTCGAGSFITGVAADGTVTCGAPAGSAGGTVTSVGAGAGLSGGPISTTGTINLTANQLLPTTACTSGQIAKWSGSAWACAADDAGPANAFVHGGNTFALGAGVASVLGNNDSRPLTIKAPQSTIKLLVDPANGDDGLRITYVNNQGIVAPNTINGSRNNGFASGIYGSTVAGGGYNDIGRGNQVTGSHGSIGGGHSNVAGQNSVVSGGTSNQAVGLRSTVSGGDANTASGQNSAIAGGFANTAAGKVSFAAGAFAKANHDFSFVWGGDGFAETLTTGVNQFVIRADGGIRLPGAGENEPNNSAKRSGTNMFTHVVPASGPCNNTEPFGLSRTAIDHPLTNGKADAILVVTANFGVQSAGAPAYNKLVVVFYDDGAGFCPTNRWVIANPNGDQNMVAGMKFNVFVINP